MTVRALPLFAFAALLFSACDNADVPVAPASSSGPGALADGSPLCDPREKLMACMNDVPAPLTELHVYQGLPGGLYTGSNTPPPSHAAAGASAARAVTPLNAQGRPSPNGKVVLLSIGMSNATQEFCNPMGAELPALPCLSHTFMGLAATDPALDRTSLVLVNGASPRLAGESWDDPVGDGDGAYANAAAALARAGVTPEQVQVVWTKVALGAEPTRPLLPDPNADAYYTLEVYGDVLRALKVRYPNLQQVYLTSRIYGGWAPSNSQTPEPWAFETGFATRWLIMAQAHQRDTGVVDPRAGDLLTAAPWVDWGPYLWSYGDRPRADGLSWPREDFHEDGTHPSESGEQKVATALLDFFKTSPYTCWFTSAGC